MVPHFWSPTFCVGRRPEFYLLRLEWVAFDDVEIGRVEDQLNSGHVTKPQSDVQHGFTLRSLHSAHRSTSTAPIYVYQFIYLFIISIER